MAIPFFKELSIGGYLIKQKLLGRKRYPLVLMLEPLFRCNLACVGCGKIDYPDAILNRRMPAQECWDAADECGAAEGAHPGRGAADPQGYRRDRARPGGAQEIRVVVHQRAAFGKEARSVRALALSVLLDPSRRFEGSPGQGGVAEGPVRAGVRGGQDRPRA